MDLIRTILLELEGHDDPVRELKLTATGYSPDMVSYHVKLLAEAGYIDANNTSNLAQCGWRPTSLTWNGHEFLDATRNSGVWQKVKAELKDKGASLPFSLIQQLAIKIAAAHFGLTGGGK
jgi:hypothetical protein